MKKQHLASSSLCSQVIGNKCDAPVKALIGDDGKIHGYTCTKYPTTHKVRFVKGKRP